MHAWIAKAEESDRAFGPCGFQWWCSSHMNLLLTLEVASSGSAAFNKTPFFSPVDDHFCTGCTLCFSMVYYHDVRN